MPDCEEIMNISINDIPVIAQADVVLAGGGL
jgi:hypothetical protein